MQPKWMSEAYADENKKQEQAEATAKAVSRELEKKEKLKRELEEQYSKLVLEDPHYEKMRKSIEKDRTEGPEHTDPERDMPVTPYPDEEMQNNLKNLQTVKSTESVAISQQVQEIEYKLRLNRSELNMIKAILFTNFGPEGVSRPGLVRYGDSAVSMITSVMNHYKEEIKTLKENK